jgi:two-component sensor histidine kinase
MFHRVGTIGRGFRGTIESAVLQKSRWQYRRARVIDAEKARRFRFDVRPFLVTISFVLASALARLGLDQIAPDISPFTTFYPAVVLSGFLWGLRPAILALLCSAAVAWWAFLPPRWTFFITPDWESLIALLIFLATGGLVVWITGAYHRTLRKLRAEQQSRELLNRELVHRGRNTIAVAQAVVSQTLRADTSAASAINGRLRALLNTNEILTTSTLQTGLLRQVIEAEVAPYGLERISLSGPPVALQPDLARTLALVIHELATNAAKYGSLSSPTGRLAINWNFDNNAVALTWMECGGPSVLPPAKVGFGTTLIKSLQQSSFSGMVDLDFRPAGLVCSVRFQVPTDGAPSSS